MREADYYRRLEDNAVECELCPHRCRIAQGKRGICRVRENRDGTLYSLVYGKLAASHLDPIEKKPLFHFLPGSLTYSVATVGCNLSCPFCQNHEISMAMRRGNALPAGYDTSVEQVIAEAVASRCRSICFTYTEPTIYFEYMADLARAAKQRGLGTTMVSNGFIEPEPLGELCSFIDAVNIDLKAFDPETYRRILGGKLEPVLDTIKSIHQAGVWTEVTTLVVTGMNDSEQELCRIAEFLASVSFNLPWHVSRYFPQNKSDNPNPTSPNLISKALDTGKRAGLKYTYAGNLPGDQSECTLCPSCGKMVIKRVGYSVREVSLKDGNHCSMCNNTIGGVFEETDMELNI
jgi:pyruvate formate lyase activating enzyme